MVSALPPLARCTGLLLAGGEGRRLGGADKGLVLLQGQPLVAHVLRRLQPQVGRVWISANRHLEQYRAYGLPVLPDAAAWQGMGPLAALATLAAQDQARGGLPGAEALVQIAPCDTPCLPIDLTHRLVTALQADPSCDVAVPHLMGAAQPALLLAKWPALASVAPYLHSGQRSVRGWLATRKACAVAFDDATAFANANDPQALSQLEQQDL